MKASNNEPPSFISSKAEAHFSKNFKRIDIPDFPHHSKATCTHGLDSPDSPLTLQKVTKDLVGIIRNLQKQLHEAPIDKMPANLLEPQNRQFFKAALEDTTTKSKNQKANNSAKSSASKTGTKVKTGPLLRRSSSKVSNISSKFGTKISNNKFRSSTCPTMPTVTSIRKMPGSSLFSDPLMQLKEEVHRAMRDHKTFTIRGQFQSVRKALLERGWVERFHSTYKEQVNEDLKKFQSYTIPDLLPLLKNQELTTTCKNLIKSKLLGGHQVDFYWGMHDDAFKDNSDKIKFTLINKLKRDIFSYTNKQGLCEAAKECHWFQKANVSKLNHPRAYCLGKGADLKSFIDDFHITAAMSLLKWVVKNGITQECKVVSPSGKIPLEAFDFAMNECCKFVKTAMHEDINGEITKATDEEWKQFLEFFYKIMHFCNHFKREGQETDETLFRKANCVLKTLKDHYQYLDMDGMMNIWILKPILGCRGKGIHICRTLQYILKTKNMNSNVRYIVQKYIERPLLIFNTKFDIRQWFLISSSSPLTIWMYKECYLRFSSQTYNLRKLHESIHLTNNSVQSKYKNTSTDAALPDYNMWDSNEFQNYLSNIGYPDAFQKVIYPGMKQCITAAVLMHQDKMVHRKNSFELYGADFIIAEDFQPWLLEINSNPALFASTPVTARMCPKVLEDVIKVVIDYANNSKAKTGGFEMIFKEQIWKLPPAQSFEIKGIPVRSDYFYKPEDLVIVEQKKNRIQSVGDDIKATLKNLLQIIHEEKHRRLLKHKSVGCGSFTNKSSEGNHINA